tara:strand:- start:136 stop:579 length:444 start_codon:yes stop_codon:yes gene_type:complete
MGLTSDIEKVFLESMGNPEDKGNIPQMAEGIANAIVDFLTKQTFTITEMKSILEVEEISTTGPIQGDVLPSVTSTGTGNLGVPVPSVVVNGTKGVLMPTMNLKKFGGQGGAMKAVGHAYIGRNPIDNEETNEDLTKVKLLEENIIGR